MAAEITNFFINLSYLSYLSDLSDPLDGGQQSASIQISAINIDAASRLDVWQNGNTQG
jgi:hypothetical protein